VNRRTSGARRDRQARQWVALSAAVAGVVGVGGSAARADFTLDGTTQPFTDNATFNDAVTVGPGGGTIDVSLGKTTVYFGPGFTAASTTTVLTKAGPGTLLFGTANGYAGDVVLALNGGGLQLRGAAGTLAAPSFGSLTAAHSVTVNPFATLTIENRNTFAGLSNSTTTAALSSTNRLADATPLILNGGSLAYVAADVAGGIRETVGVVTLNQGASTITVGPGNTGGTIGGELLLSGLAPTAVNAAAPSLGTTGNPAGTANGGGTVNFASSTGTLGTAGNAGRVFVTGVADQTIVGGYATVGAEFAGYTTANGVVAASALGAGGNMTLTAGPLPATGGNVRLAPAAAAASAVASGGSTLNSLNLTATATDLTFAAAADRLTLASGGFLAGNVNRAVGTTASRGLITSGLTPAAGNAAELYFHVNGSTTTVNSFVVNNGGTPVALVKDQAGALVLNAPAASLAAVSAAAAVYSGGTFVSGGTLTAAAAGTLGSGPAFATQNASLVLGAQGATSYAGGTAANPTYYAYNNGSVNVQNLAGAGLTAGQAIRVGPQSFLFLNGSTSAAALDGGGTGGTQNLFLDDGAIVAANTVANANAVGAKLGAAPRVFLGLNGANFTENVTVGAGTPWVGLSTDRSARTYAGSASNATNTITANGDFAIQGFLNNGAYQTFTLGNGVSGATPGANVVRVVPGNGATAVNASLVGNVTFNNDKSVYEGVTFVATPGSTVLANVATAFGGGDPTPGGTGASVPANLVVQGGATLNLNGAVANTVNANVTFQAGGTFLADDNLAGGTLNGTAGSLAFQPGSVVQIQGGNGSVNALSGNLVPASLPGVVLRFNGNTNSGFGVNGFGVTGLLGRIAPGQVIEAIGGTNSLTTATNTPADNLTTDGQILTAGVAGGTLGQGGGRLIVGPGGLTLAGNAILPPQANNGNASFRLQEDFELLAGRTLTVGSAAVVDGLAKANGYVFLTSQGARGTAGGLVDVVAGAQLQVDDFHVIPDPSVVRLAAGTSVLLNRANATETVGGLASTGAGGAVTANTTGTVLQIGYADQSSTFGGTFAAAGTAGVPFANQAFSVTKIGLGDLALTGASTTPGTFNQTGGTTTLTGAAGSFKFATVQLNRGTLVVDNAAAALANRLGGVGGATPTGPNLRLGGGNLTLSGGGTETLGNINFDGGGLSTLSLGTGTLNVVAGSADRSITTVVLRGTNLGAGGAAGTFLTNRPNLTGTFAAGQVTTGVRPDVLSDTPAAGGAAAGLAFTTYDPAAGFRRLAAAETTAVVFPGQNLANNLSLTAPVALAFPVSAVPGQQPAFGADTTVQSLTLAGGAALTVAPTPTATGGLPRLVISSNGLLVNAGAAASISAPFIQNTLYVTNVADLSVAGQVTNGSLVKAGAGTLTLGPGTINNVDGNVAVNEGKVVLGAGSRLFLNGTTGYGARSLFLSGGTLDLGGNSVVAGTLVSSNYGQNPPGTSAGSLVNSGGPADLTAQGNGTFTGTIDGVRNLTKYGNNTMALNNGVNIAGDLTIRAGTVSLLNGGKISGATSATLNVGVLSLNNIDSLNFNQKPDLSGPAVTDRIGPNVPIALTGSQLQFRGAPGTVDAQTFGGASTGVTAAAGSNIIDANVGANGSANVTVGNLTRDAGARAFVNFTGTNVGNTGELYQVSHFTVGNLNGSPTPDAGTGAASIIAPWALVNGGDFATYKSTARGLSSLGNVNNGYAAYSAAAVNAVTGTTATTTAGDIVATAGATEVAGVTARTVGALRLNNGNNAATLTLNAGEVLTVAGGGVIANTNNTMLFTGGSITSGYQPAGAPSRELYFWAQQNTTTVASALADGAGPVAFVRGGAGSVVLTGANAHTGGTFLTMGTTTFNSAGTAVPLANAALAAAGVADLTLVGNANTSTVAIANTATQIAGGARVLMTGGATLRLNDAAVGTTVLGGLTVNNVGGGATPTVQIANLAGGGTLQLAGNVAVTNDHFANVPTINQNLGSTANAVTLATLDLGGAARTFDVGGLSVLGLNVQAAVTNGSLVKTGPGTLGLGVANANLLLTGGNTGTVTNVTNPTPGTNSAGYSISTISGLQIGDPANPAAGAGVVRVDSPGALGSGTTTVNPGGTLLANVNSANVFNFTPAPATATPVTGNLALAGGIVQAITSTPVFGGSVSLTASSTVSLQDFYQTTTSRSITIAGPVTVNAAAAGPTLSVASGTNTGSVGTLLLSNNANNFANAGAGGGAATLAVAPNATVTAQSSTTFGSTIAGAAINLAGGRLNILTEGTTAAQTNATLAYGNNVTVTGPAQINADRVTAVTGNTIVLGSLSLASTLTTSTGTGAYTITFGGGTSLAGGADVGINSNATTNLGAVTVPAGVPTSISKFGGASATVSSWPAALTASAVPVTIGNGALVTTGLGTGTALTAGPTVIRFGGELRNGSGGTNAVNYSPSTLVSEGNVRANSGIMRVNTVIASAGGAASGQPFSAFAERVVTGPLNDVGILLESPGNFLTVAPASTGVLNNQRLSFTDLQIAARGRVLSTNDSNVTNLGAVWTGTLTVGGTGAAAVPANTPISFGLNSDDGSALYVDANNNGAFEAAERVVDDRGGHGATQIVNAIPGLAAGNYRIGIAYYDSGSGGSVEARYFPGVVGAGVTPNTNSPAGTVPPQTTSATVPQNVYGFQPVPYANQFVINPGNTPAGTVQVDAGAQMQTVGFTAETVSLVGNGTVAGSPSILGVNNATGTAAAPFASTAQNLFANSNQAFVAGPPVTTNYTGLYARLDVGANNVLSITDSFGVGTNATLMKAGAGTLLVNAANAAANAGSSVQVNAGRLGGSGSIAAPLQVNGGAAVLSPGNSPGRLTLAGGGAGVPALQFTATAGAAGGGGTAGTPTFELDLVGPGNADQVLVATAASFTGAAVDLGAAVARLLVLNPAAAQPGTYVIVDNATPSPTAGTFAGTTTDPLAQFALAGDPNRYLINYGFDAEGDGANNDVALTIVPEPTTVGLAAGAVVGLLGRRRRRVPAAS
jgi:fibronectin-binding autotransporter adhesin